MAGEDTKVAALRSMTSSEGWEILLELWENKARELVSEVLNMNKPRDDNADHERKMQIAIIAQMIETPKMYAEQVGASEFTTPDFDPYDKGTV